MSLSVAIRLGAYEVVAVLGAGGMGEVYRARDTRLNREVAIKVLPNALAADTQHLARFQLRSIIPISPPFTDSKNTRAGSTWCWSW